MSVSAICCWIEPLLHYNPDSFNYLTLVTRFTVCYEHLVQLCLLPCRFFHPKSFFLKILLFSLPPSLLSFSFVFFRCLLFSFAFFRCLSFSFAFFRLSQSSLFLCFSVVTPLSFPFSFYLLSSLNSFFSVCQFRCVLSLSPPFSPLCRLSTLVLLSASFFSSFLLLLSLFLLSHMCQQGITIECSSTPNSAAV